MEDGNNYIIVYYLYRYSAWEKISRTLNNINSINEVITSLSSLGLPVQLTNEVKSLKALPDKPNYYCYEINSEVELTKIIEKYNLTELQNWGSLTLTFSEIIEWKELKPQTSMGGSRKKKKSKKSRKRKSKKSPKKSSRKSKKRKSSRRKSKSKSKKKRKNKN